MRRAMSSPVAGTDRSRATAKAANHQIPQTRAGARAPEWRRQGTTSAGSSPTPVTPMRLLAAVLLALSFPAAGEPAAATPDPAACAVWTRELGFARSVAEHDAAAFADHVAEGAVFGAGGPRPVRGRAAIVRDWADLVAGSRVRLEWYPRQVTANAAGDLAWSTGPALTEVLDPAAPQRYLLSRFRSVWRKEADGQWRVVFDEGDPPRPASAAEAQAFRAARPSTCAPG